MKRETEVQYCQRRITEIREKYSRPDQQQYQRLVIAAWQRHMQIVMQQEGTQR